MADTPYSFSESGAKRIVRTVRAFERATGREGVDVSRPIEAIIGSTDSPDTIGASSEGSESADTSAWDRVDDATPVDVWVIGRVGYFHAGDEKLYGYARKLSFDATGRLYAVSAETRVEIDAPEDC